MSKYLFLVLLLLGITANANAQDMMLNGSFEECDGVAPSGTVDAYNIEYGAYWHNLIGTCDLINPCVPNSVTGSSCFGAGCGRFGLNSTGYIEYLYGTTLPLTAGQIYEVSFWIKKDYTTESLRRVGLAITETVPTPAITSTTPLISEVITSTQCVKLKACFTAQNSVTHYVTIGPFGGAAPETIVYLVDSVSVMTIPPTTPLAQASLSASEPVLCFGEQVTLDGTASANETSYEWNIYNTTTGNQLFYSSGIIQGTAGTLTPTLQFPIPGSCYRAELTVYGVCKDVATVEFCIADPDIDFIFDGNPVCENFPVDLQVTGDNGWVYTWTQTNDTLSSGVGLKTLTVTPTVGNATYSVTVTTPEGCTHTETLTLNVNSQNNIAPWMDGINGTGEYTYYVSQGDAVFFNSLLSNDHPNEEIDLIPNTNIPPGFITIPPGSSGGVFSFSWMTSLGTSVGEYYYQITAFDNNACDPDTSIFKFRIIVVCDQCPVCISYENRTPSGTPLPAETKAGKCIQSGFTQVVSTGDANVTFIAGKTLDYGTFWDAGPGYEGIIEPTTCITDCEDCCSDWAGFTYDELPNPFFMNFGDEDPTNDFIQVTDTYHPFCAFNAKGYSFEIVDNHQNLMNNIGSTGQIGSACCSFESPAPENPIAHSSIWWDGYTENMWGNNVRPNSGVYTYVLTLYGCNGQEVTMHGFIEVFGSNGMVQAPGGTQQAEATLSDSPLGPEQQRQLEESIAEHERFDKELSLSPNPTTDLVKISGTGSDDVYYQIFDDKGVMLSHKEKAENLSFSLTNYSKGTYYIRIYSGTTYAVRKVVKM
ncbi:T9SS type A sorting domain-containing protein [Fluviicola chungangensis]|uniref:T9SS type A sorting domain-containing protein n=1 Tax=Fluviicola chungangensis TaxID=2597671 RepID=A0A556N619_9FLAO|nr:T9SS type A sorting domain-containing protein [Fluviicola chungangensis]TSJ47575.1 T9SS type A sorting domain-containing protein [Fluviicola chungangensis]